jgi:hypothetical protein
VHWSGYDTTALDIEVDPQRCRFGRRKSDFALPALLVRVFQNPANPATSGTFLEAAETAVSLFAH